MATLTIRNLEDRIREALRYRAQANGRSTEAEVRFLLEQSVTGGVDALEHRCSPRRRFAEIEPLVLDHPESAQAVLDYLRGDR